MGWGGGGRVLYTEGGGGCHCTLHFRDQSLVTGRGPSQVLPLKKGRGNNFSHAEGEGGGGRFEVVLLWGTALKF